MVSPIGTFVPQLTRPSPRCHVWLSITNGAPPEPFQILESVAAARNSYPSKYPGPDKLEDAFKQLRIDRTCFKNMHIHLTDPSILETLLDSGRGEPTRSQAPTAYKGESSDLSPTLQTPLNTTDASISAPENVTNTKHVPTPVSKHALSVIADEAGIDVKDLSPTTKFEDIGMDSLLSITIILRLEDEGLQVAESIFRNYPTVQELEAFLEKSTTCLSDKPEIKQVSSKAGRNVRTLMEKNIHQVIASELHIDVADFDSTTKLGDVGMDSLVAIPVRIRLGRMGWDVPIINILGGTVQDIARYLGDSQASPSGFLGQKYVTSAGAHQAPLVQVSVNGD